MKKDAPTMIDALYRMTFRNDKVFGIADNSQLRERLRSARRFVLDDGMSTFLGDLATAAFVAAEAKRDLPLQHRMAEQLRISARAPFPAVWIEYNLRNSLRRSNELRGIDNAHIDTSVPQTEGWLIERHPELTTAFRVHLFTNNPLGQEDEQGYRIWGFPIVYSWTVNDSPSPWRSIIDPDSNPKDSELATGIQQYDSCGAVTLTKSEFMDDPVLYKNREAIKELILEWVGTLRRMWALLATLNDIPVLKTEVKQVRGFVARGRYRRYLDHAVVTLHVPQKTDTRKLARSLIAIARRRAHQVRGHFRKDWRNPGSRLCDHEWSVDNICSLCGGHRLWITEHMRGDATLGLVTHDYQVKHGTEDDKGDQGVGALPHGAL